MVLLLVSTGLSLVATSLLIRQRALLEDANRIHLVAMTDAGLAECLANLAVDPAFGGYAADAWGRGTLESAVEHGGHGRLVTVRARIGSLRRTIVADVRLPPGDPPRVVGWQVVPDPG